MVRVLIAGLVAMVIAVAVGPQFIEWLRRQSIGQHIREEGPAGHIAKQGTPTMGGLLIVVAAFVPALIVSLYTLPGITVLLATLGCGLIGFADDFLKVRKRRSLGLPGRWKMFGLLLITAGVGWATTQIGYMDTEIYFPLIDVNIDLHWLYFPFLFLVIAGTSNSVNLTDGVDGLAAGTCAVSLITLLAIASIDWIRSADVVANRSEQYLDLAIVAAALIGGVIGFLWFNAFPAEMFMGDTGSMALGGAIATLAILTETEVLLVFIGGVFLFEAVTWIIQIATFKRTGKRVFLMVPIHHHFELKAWSETKIMVRFWIIGAILCAIGFVLYYRYYLLFHLEDVGEADIAPRDGGVRLKSNTGPRALAPVLVSLAVMVFWGATPVVTRIATEDLDPLWVAVLRTVLAGVAAVPLIATVERRPPSSARSRLLLGVSSAAGFVIFPIVFTIGQERTSAMHGVGILAALPVFTGLYGMLVVRGRPGAWWLAGCALALAGEAVIVAVRAGGGGTATLVGDLLVLAAALVVSAGYVAGALLVPRGFSSAATTYWGVLLAAAALLPLAVVLVATGGAPHAGAASWAAVLFLALVTSIAGYVGWYWALARGGIARIAPLQFLQPLSGLVLAALLLGERLTWPLACGAAAVITGVAIARRP